MKNQNESLSDILNVKIDIEYFQAYLSVLRENDFTYL